VVVDTLSDEFDVMQVALAAVKLAYEAGGAETDEEEIPEIQPRAERPAHVERPNRGHRPERGQRPERGRRRPGSDRMTRLFIGIGRSAGVRPQDLVGAITGESTLSGREIGAIDIADRFALVEVPEAAAGEVIDALRGATIKGRRPTVRQDRR